MLATFNCRQPVKLLPQADESALPGFLDMASGRFVSDRSAGMVNLGVAMAPDWRTIATPVLKGFGGISYSWSARRWLPTPWELVAPDGFHYAYPELGQWLSSSPITNVEIKLHAVDLSAGFDRVISTGPGWGILDYRSDGIYVTKTRYYSGESNNGLWRMDPTTGATRQLLPESATTLFLGGNAAWSSDVPIAPTTLYRYDLKSGTREVWYARPNWVVVLTGTDGAGQPLVSVFARAEAGELWLLSGPNQGVLIHSGDGPWSAGPRDSHGTWMIGQTGLWLFQPNGRLTHVTTAQVQPLGDCR
jgi:hypothetical protein